MTGMGESKIPRISVIMPVYNPGPLLIPAVKSVCEQTYSDFELILVDDGSTDGSGQICRELMQKDSRIRLIAQPNSGICAARNRGMAEMRGEWFTFCDDDDRMLPNALEKMIELAQDSGAAMVRTGYRLMRENAQGRPTELPHPAGTAMALTQEGTGKDYQNFLRQSGPQFVWNALYRRRCFGSLRFDESCRMGLEDFIFNAEVYALHPCVVYDPYVTYEHLERGESTSACGNVQAVMERLSTLHLWAAAEKKAAQVWCDAGEEKLVLSCRMAEFVTFAMHQIRDGRLSRRETSFAWHMVRTALDEYRLTLFDIYRVLRQNKKQGIALLLYFTHLQGLYSCLPNREEKLLKS